MADNIITYESFRRFELQEKDNDALQKLPEDFYNSCREWIKRKEALYETSRDQTILREIENTMMRVKKIMELRERKIVTLALHYVRGGAVPQNLLPSEKTCFDTLVSGLEKLKNTNLENVRGAYTKISAKAPLERFVGTDGKVYGPLNAGDAAEVPGDIARLLVERGLAVAV